MVATGESHSVISLTVSQTHSHKTDNHVVAGKTDGSTLNGNSFTRRRLSCNRHLAMITHQAGLELNHARHLEHNGTRANIRRARLAQTACAIVVQVCHINHLATTTTESVTAIAFGTFKCKTSRLKAPHIALSHRRTVHFIYAPVISRKRSRSRNLVGRAGLFALVNRCRASCCFCDRGRIRAKEYAVLGRAACRRPGQRESAIVVWGVVIQIRW